MDSLERVTAEVQSAVDAQRDPRLRLRAYVRAVLRLADSGDRALGRALSDLGAAPGVLGRPGGRCTRGSRPRWSTRWPRSAPPDPARDAAYAQGALDAAARRIESGRSPRSEAAAAEAFISAVLSQAHSTAPG